MPPEVSLMGQQSQPSIRLARIDHERVRGSIDLFSDSPSASEFNTAFHTEAEIGGPIPSEEPYDFTRWLSLVLETRGLLPGAAQTIHLTAEQARLLITASTASIITRKPNLALADDIADLIVEPCLSKLSFPEAGLFMRLDACSAKDGAWSAGGTRSLHSTEDVVLRLLTSARAHSALTKVVAAAASDSGAPQTSIRLTFVPFNSRMESRREYRVFCNPGEGRITAISQYQWHTRWFFAFWRAPTSSLDEDEDAQIGKAAVARLKAIQDIWLGAQNIRNKIVASLQDEDDLDQLLARQGFTFDIFYDEESAVVELVELNVFGARSACGACLFHWIRDYALLYGEQEEIEFRVTY